MRNTPVRFVNFSQPTRLNLGSLDIPIDHYDKNTIIAGQKLLGELLFFSDLILTTILFAADWSEKRLGGS